MNPMSFLIELLKRIATASPKFFIVARWVFGIAGILLAGFLALCKLNVVHISENVMTVLVAVNTFIGGIWAACFLPVQDKK